MHQAHYLASVYLNPEAGHYQYMWWWTRRQCMTRYSNCHTVLFTHHRALPVAYKSALLPGLYSESSTSSKVVVNQCYLSSSFMSVAGERVNGFMPFPRMWSVNTNLLQLELELGIPIPCSMLLTIIIKKLFQSVFWFLFNINAYWNNYLMDTSKSYKHYVRKKVTMKRKTFIS